MKDEDSPTRTGDESAAAIVSTASPQHVEVPVAALREGSVLPFPVYARIGDSWVIYREEGERFDRDHRERLEQLDCPLLWIPTAARDAYLSYLEGSVREALEDPRRSVGDKFNVVCDSGAAVTRQLFANPASKSAQSAAENAVQSSILLLSRHELPAARFADLLRGSPDLYAHSMQVCLYGLALARAAGFEPDDQSQDLGMGLLCHDIGKLDLPQAVLEKLDDLTEEEWVLVRRHPQCGVDRVASCRSLSPLARDVILNHHERIDGGGYPRGVDGSQLSVAARIAAIVNAFDSRTTHRPYRPARPSFEVLQAMLADEDAYDHRLLKRFVESMTA